ncbi:MAG: shikimate dehydrogenase [Chloroflexota bacterium]|nr:MAG: shikimate dehydrogenase [Chloroflexota bacterium]
MSTDRYAVIGNPIAHSLSPVMQGAAFRATGIDARYDCVRVEADDVEGVLDDVRSGVYRGLNVTIPHKQLVTGLMDELAPAARRLSVVNTVVSSWGRLVGHNTDVDGFMAALASLELPANTGLAIVLGSGGAARAALEILRPRFRHICLVSRDPARAAAVALLGGARCRALPRRDLTALLARPDCSLLVNATPLGMEPLGHACPVPQDAYLQPQTAVLDLVYGRETPLLARARRAGCVCSDGLEMLVGQGAAAFRLWTSVKPDLQIMRDACVRELRKVETCSVS